jgi:hypothetical protein
MSLIGEQGVVAWTQAVTRSTSGSVAGYSLQLENEPASTIPFDAPTQAIRGIAAAMEQHLPASWQASGARHSTWSAATRAMEFVDAVELSLQKGRTIEVHQQKLTEQLAFRGTMAAFGCGLMLLVTLATIVVGLIGGAESLLQEKKLIQWWAVAILTVLCGFLLLQIVPLLGKRRHHDAGAPDGDDEA